MLTHNRGPQAAGGTAVAPRTDKPRKGIRKRRQADAVEESEIRARLRSLLERYPQAEVARRTHVLPSRVSRYLQDTAIPVVFCSRLVKEFGLNPAWLLTGEGAPYLSDVAESTGQLAGNLLEVVNALNAVTHLRIGSLGGKRQAQVLRDLGDAMERHDKLHNRLNAHSAPILRQVMQDLRNALDRMDINQRHLFDKSKLAIARGLSRTAGLLARFCDDPRLRFDLILLQGRLATYEEDLPGVLECTRKAILLAVGRNEFADEPALATLAESVDALRAQRRLHEARRVAESMLAATMDEARHSPSALRLAALAADIQVNTGELKPGLDTLARIRGSMAGQHRLEADAWLVTAWLYSGAMETHEAAAVGVYHLGQAARVLAVALMMETKDAVASGIAYWDHKPEIKSWERYYAGVLLRALTKKDEKLASDVRSVLKLAPQPGAPPLGSFLHHYNLHMKAIYGAQIHRLMRATAEARRYFLESCKVIDGLPDWYCLTIGWRAIHMRNALELGSNTQKEQAREFFRHHLILGYRCFAGWGG